VAVDSVRNTFPVGDAVRVNGADDGEETLEGKGARDT
jgi:hypothetical protein